MASTAPTRLEFHALKKDYENTKALQPLSLAWEGGKIHALIGKNGSGKSTLIKMIAGAISPSAGDISLDKKKIKLKSPQDALKLGIATVHQELSLIPEFTVCENIFLGRLPKKNGLIDWKKLAQQTRVLLDDMGAKDIDVHARTGSLSVGLQQVVEIAKAMSTSPRVLQLDEPTSALAREEVQQLFSLLRRLRDRGVLLIYVSHRLAELGEITDDITVLRDGQLIGTVGTAGTSSQTIVDMMFGEMQQRVQSERSSIGPETVLEVRNVCRRGLLHNISFSLRRGEILGIAGMLGSGRTELLRGIFGADMIDSGEIFVAGKIVDKPSPQKMRELGIAYTSEDRKAKGLVQMLSCHANLCLAGMRYIAKKWFITETLETPFVRRQIKDLHIKLRHTQDPISSLSGGNQQKIVIGNWLNIQPKVIMLDEPSRGIDIHAKQQIFESIRQFSAQGLAAIMVSTELEELPEICHRILVLKNGEFTEELTPDCGAKTLYTATMSQMLH